MMPTFQLLSAAPSSPSISPLVIIIAAVAIVFAISYFGVFDSLSGLFGRSKPQATLSATELRKQAEFVDGSETVVASIGSNYIQNIMTGGQVKRGYALLTQKRLYYKGKSFSNVGKQAKSETEESILDVSDITFTKFIYTRNTGLLIIGILGLIIAAFLFSQPAIAGTVLAVSLAFLIGYFVHKVTLFAIFFPGGKFTFDVRWYPKTDMIDFQRQLHLIKDVKRYGAN